MPARLVLTNVVHADQARLPRVAEMGFSCASVIADGVGGDCPGWCISLVTAEDLLPLDSEPGAAAKVFLIPDMEPAELGAMMPMTPNELGWTDEQLRYAQDMVAGRGGTSVPGPDDPLEAFFTALATLLGARAAYSRMLWAM
jgi:hypothetical protein